MSRLTFKQREFVKEYVKTNGNGTQSILRVYDTKDSKTASVMATENLNKPSVKEELDKRLQRSDININRLTDKMSDIIASEPSKGYSGSDIVEVIKTGLKLHGVLSDKRVTTNVNIDGHLSSLSTYELMQLRNKKKKETDIIIQGEETK